MLPQTFVTQKKGTRSRWTKCLCIQRILERISTWMIALSSCLFLLCCWRGWFHCWSSLIIKNVMWFLPFLFVFCYHNLQSMIDMSKWTGKWRGIDESKLTKMIYMIGANGLRLCFHFHDYTLTENFKIKLGHKS